MSQLLTIVDALDITATGAGEPVRLNVTPFAGGFGREALMHLPAAVGGSGEVDIEGHWSPSSEEPADDDDGWEAIVTLDASSPLLQELSDLPAWIRANVTTAGTGTLTVVLEGTP